MICAGVSTWINLPKWLHGFFAEGSSSDGHMNERAELALQLLQKMSVRY